MKKNYIKILILFILSLSMSCSEINTEGGNLYKGTWLWLKTVGGLFPRVTTPENGTSIKIWYDRFHSFRIFRNDTLKVTANYKIEGKEYDRDKISYSNIVTYDYYFYPDTVYAKIYSDTLEIWDGYIDGYFSFYKKID